MAISKIKLPDNSVQDLHDARGVDTNGSFYFVAGSSSAAGNSTSGEYLSTKWEGTVPGVSAAYNGLKIAYRIATNTGVSGGGVVLSIDNGAHYYPVVIQKNTMVTTHYPVGATFLAVFNSTQTATAYLTAGTKSTVTGCWQIMEYDSNTNTYQREYVSTGDTEYPVTARYNTTTGETYYAEYGRYSEGVTLNPSKNSLTASEFIVTNGTSSQFLKADGSVDSSTYLTSFTETDPTVPSWAKASSKPSYTASEVGALSTSATLSDLSNVSSTSPTDGQALIWDNANSTWKPGTVSGGGGVTDVTVGGTSVVTNGVAAVPAIPTVPTNVSAFNNDAGYTTNTGTITSVKMNGSTVASSGEADLGTVITSETSLSKGTTTGNGNAVTDISVSGHQITLTKGSTFLTSETSLSKGTTTGSGNAVTDINVSGHTITLTKGSTFLTSYTETDPVFTASAAYGISSSDITNWNAKQKAITVSSSEPTSGQGSNGDIWIVI